VVECGARKSRSRSSGVSGATIQNADRIVVVDESGVAEEGRHDDLIAAGGIYRRLHTAQFGTLVV
jgi:ABC-type transport system involved in cytochrome bd biosynthesis fused ATPase/permease subunit